VGTVPVDRLISLALPPLMTLAILLITGYLVYLSPRAPSASALMLALVALLTTVANCLLALRTLYPGSPALVPLAILLLMSAFLSLTALPRLDGRAAQAADQTGPLLSVLVRSVPLVLVAILALLVADARLAGLSEPDALLLLYQRALAVCTLLILVRQWLMLRANAALLRALQTSNQALTHAHEQAQREARTDPLTGLPNQRLLREYLETSLAYHRRTGLPLTVLFLDLDFFKAINDRFGHSAGDAALVEVGGRLRRSLRAGDIVARYGGEEFVVLLPGTDTVEGRVIAERLRQQIGGQPVTLPGHHAASVTVSIGLVTSRHVVHSAGDLLAAADAALYTAKQSGRDCVCQATPMQAAD
jgi:diguanylate cyclase (GGDEF)-like protein